MKFFMGVNFFGKYRKMLNFFCRVGFVVLWNIFEYGCFNGMFFLIVIGISCGICIVVK